MLIHTTASGQQIQLSDLENDHLLNICSQRLTWLQNDLINLRHTTAPSPAAAKCKTLWYTTKEYLYEAAHRMPVGTANLLWVRLSYIGASKPRNLDIGSVWSYINWFDSYVQSSLAVAAHWHHTKPCVAPTSNTPPQELYNKIKGWLSAVRREPCNNPTGEWLSLNQFTRVGNSTKLRWNLDLDCGKTKYQITFTQPTQQHDLSDNSLYKVELKRMDFKKDTFTCVFDECSYTHIYLSEIDRWLAENIW